MKCSEVQKLLLKENINEMSRTLKSEAEHHVLHCSECRAFFTAAENYSRLIDTLNITTPELDHDLVYAGIMNSIPSKTIKGSAVSNVTDIFNKLLNPVPKLAFGIILIVITTFYFVQELTDVQKISLLEKQFSTQVKTTAPTSSLINKADLFANINFIFNGSRNFTGITGSDEEWEFIISQLAGFTNILMSKEIENNNELKKYLNSIVIDARDGLDYSEIHALIKNKSAVEAILKEDNLHGGKIK